MEGESMSNFISLAFTQSLENTALETVSASEMLVSVSPEDSCTVHMSNTVKGRGKAIPIQAWTCPECSRRLRLPDFKTVGT